MIKSLMNDWIVTNSLRTIVEGTQRNQSRMYCSQVHKCISGLFQSRGGRYLKVAFYNNYLPIVYYMWYIGI